MLLYKFLILNWVLVSHITLPKIIVLPTGVVNIVTVTVYAYDNDSDGWSVNLSKLVISGGA